MKSKVSRWKCVHYRLLNKYTPIVLAMFIPGVLCVETAYATNGVVKFGGTLTQASCEVHPPLPGERGGRVVQVSAGITLTVATLNNVCSESAAPVTLGYQALPASVAAVPSGTDVRRGVVTMTYE